MNRMFLLGIGFFLATTVAAAPTAHQALAFERSVWLIRTGFHQLALGGNAEDDIGTLEQTLEQGRQAASVFVQGLEESDAAHFRQDWDAYQERALDNPLATLGYADFNALSELNRLAWRLSQRAKPYTGQAASAEEKILQARVVLHRVSSEYLALASFPSAGLTNGAEGAENMNFQQEVLDFERLIQGLQGQAERSSSARRMLSQIQLRWEFVREPLLEMDKTEVNRVPLLLYRYSLQIDRDLARLSAASSD